MAYIEKEKLIIEIDESAEKSDLRFPRGRAVKEALEIVKKHIDTIPASDVAPVVHGYWKTKVLQFRLKDNTFSSPIVVGYRCSVCGRDEDQREPYCNCGAKMDGDSDEKLLFTESLDRYDFL